MSQESQVSKALAKALEQLWADGSPVAGGATEEWERRASFALRRMQSIDRRKVPSNQNSQRVTDLAKALAAQFEREPQRIGPLISDYEHMADVILAIYAQQWE